MDDEFEEEEFCDECGEFLDYCTCECDCALCVNDDPEEAILLKSAQMLLAVSLYDEPKITLDKPHRPT